eukprot:TRINITY_DN781799_c0_g1_i1.p1 TRINITY_DN781799_c0_g1~~TRINITY_DN781799_c0_g1_i1.p1  ORF type:complete len:196 (+),score=28.81 TRINITY_DN781799_c0_g1_i1:74-661(+)
MNSSKKAIFTLPLQILGGFDGILGCIGILWAILVLIGTSIYWIIGKDDDCSHNESRPCKNDWVLIFYILSVITLVLSLAVSFVQYKLFAVLLKKPSAEDKPARKLQIILIVEVVVACLLILLCVPFISSDSSELLNDIAYIVATINVLGIAACFIGFFLADKIFEDVAPAVATSGYLLQDPKVNAESPVFQLSLV